MWEDSLEEAELGEARPILGISDAEIDELAAAQAQMDLPLVYQEFLEDCGKSAGLFQCDSDFFFPEVKGLRRQLVEMLEDGSIDFSLPAKAFVFGAYQGFQFHYFICDGVDDPSVYQVDDGGNGPELVAESFSGYIKNGIAQYRDAFRRKF